ncbi:hypothetical protein PR048_032642 [Dryococelus australis]|uniref:Uncharacterized protein n=1 Tax=Dryococelus australis TaxID=614101 RepID=A0ABQ9G2S1_9NEOP|nr:hypothetical protein PR048_032642 [Dryococelus australis]
MTKRVCREPSVSGDDRDQCRSSLIWVLDGGARRVIDGKPARQFSALRVEAMREFVAHVSVAPSAPTLLGLRRSKFLQPVTPMPYPGLDPRANRTADRCHTNRLRHGRSADVGDGKRTLTCKINFRYLCYPPLLLETGLSSIGLTIPQSANRCVTLLTILTRKLVPGIRGLPPLVKQVIVLKTPKVRWSKLPIGGGRGIERQPSLKSKENRLKCAFQAEKKAKKTHPPAVGAAVAERLARSPPTKANRARSPAVSPDFRKWESCWTMPLVGGFSRGSTVSPAPSFRRRTIFPSITLIGSQDLAVKSRPNIFTHSAAHLHFVCIRNFSRLVAHQLSKMKCKKFVCKRCLQYLQTEDILASHTILASTKELLVVLSPLGTTTNSRDRVSSPIAMLTVA